MGRARGTRELVEHWVLVAGGELLLGGEIRSIETGELLPPHPVSEAVKQRMQPLFGRASDFR